MADALQTIKLVYPVRSPERSNSRKLRRPLMNNCGAPHRDFPVRALVYFIFCSSLSVLANLLARKHTSGSTASQVS
ncbi:hypothetical protein [Pseudomonas sp. B21-048]|uniref:hypothetical protein n=1 Tax=Pseudomonas sp. B21-048 TaxID=2895490 RepID=UPI00215F1B20|nr:hypothetical protein [Pseudomonas sp. B21-048]UVL01052.1 hypothetical protein LOY56_12185 [Pseudomonas sp. B21-048]